MKRLVLVLLVGALSSTSVAAVDDVAALKSSFEGAVAALNSGNMDGFLATVHDEALSFYACGPTSGKQGREACALDWKLFFDSSSDAKFETRNEQYRVIGSTGIAYGEYSLSVEYNKDGGRQVVHEGRYTMTYTKVGNQWRIVMQHNTPMADGPQPVRTLRPAQK